VEKCHIQQVVYYWKKNSEMLLTLLLHGFETKLVTSPVQYTVPVKDREIQMIAIAKICEKPKVAPSLDMGKRQTSLMERLV
jgi:hypothetical protein